MKNLSGQEVLEYAIDIAHEYRGQGLTLTLRQMYYQFVARGLIPSGQKYYSKIGVVLTKARYDGTFPIDLILDRGRDVHPGSYTEFKLDLDEAKERAETAVAHFPEIFLKVARWYGQPNFVSVWVEKQALEGVFEPICEELGVSWFACKGYPSVSALSAWTDIAMQVCMEDPEGSGEFEQASADKAVVLYFGDHDPDGFEIPRSAHRGLERILEVKGRQIEIVFKRVALNMKQIEQFSPPPFDAKVTSSRYHSYVEEHSTRKAWELDALEPTVLRKLIQKEVNALFDKNIYAHWQEKLAEAREEFRGKVQLKVKK